MSIPEPFYPQSVFAHPLDGMKQPPRVFISPHRYIQGEGVIDSLGRYLTILPGRKPLLLMTAGGNRRFGQRVQASFAGTDIESQLEIFNGECSTEEVERITQKVRQTGLPLDSVVAAGGGKCLDAGKCVASRLGVPVILCPTIASTDAPCSAVSVIYTPEGVGKGPEFFRSSPALVIVDTGIMATSPIRHLVAGMGDALATCYEARTCFRNPAARSMVGGRITLAALTLAELCAKTVFEDGKRALEALRNGRVDPSVERVVEANTLLSGIGFESGGLAAAHALAAGLTVIPILHREFLHGELVSIGLIAHLILESEPEEARRAARLLSELGLPVRLKQFRLDMRSDARAFMEAAKAALKEPFAGNEPFEVTPEKLLAALGEADRLGTEIVAETGEALFQILHS